MLRAGDVRQGEPTERPLEEAAQTIGRIRQPEERVRVAVHRVVAGIAHDLVELCGEVVVGERATQDVGSWLTGLGDRSQLPRGHLAPRPPDGGGVGGVTARVRRGLRPDGARLPTLGPRALRN